MSDALFAWSEEPPPAPPPPPTWVRPGRPDVDSGWPSPCYCECETCQEDTCNNCEFISDMNHELFCPICVSELYDLTCERCGLTWPHALSWAAQIDPKSPACQNCGNNTTCPLTRDHEGAHLHQAPTQGAKR